MKNGNGKFALLVTILLLVALVFSACSSLATSSTAATTTAGTGATTTAATTTAADVYDNGLPKTGDINLTIVAGVSGYGREIYDSSITDFEAMYPNVNIEITVSPKVQELVTTSISAEDNMFDIVMGTYGFTKSLCESGKVEPLNDYMALSTWDDSKVKMGDDYFPDAVAQFTYDGNSYVAPIATGVLGIFYNKAMFKENSWNETPKNWSEFITLCDTIKNKGITPICFGGSVGYTSYLTSNAALNAGGKEYGEKLAAKVKGIYSEAASLAPYIKLAELAAKGFLLQGSEALNHTQSQMEFLQGTTAMVACGAWIENEMKDSAPEGFEYGYMIPPTNDNEAETLYISSFADGIWLWADKDELNKKWSKEYLRYFFSNKMQAIYIKNGAIPAVRSALSSEECRSGATAFLQSVMSTLSQDGVGVDLYASRSCAVDQSSKKAEVDKILSDGWLGVYLGTTTPEKIGAEADAKLEEAWADVGGRK